MEYEKTPNEALNRKSLIDFKRATKTPLVLILDDVRSMHNVGSIFRTADAFLIEGICLCGITPRPPHREIHKTALGATETVQWHYEQNIAIALQHYLQQGYELLAIEQTQQSKFLDTYSFKPLKRYVFVLGNEMNGVQKEALSFMNDCIEVPQYGTKHSMNVAVCAGVCIWEYVKQIKHSMESK